MVPPPGVGPRCHVWNVSAKNRGEFVREGTANYWKSASARGKGTAAGEGLRDVLKEVGGGVRPTNLTVEQLRQGGLPGAAEVGPPPQTLTPAEFGIRIRGSR